MLRLFPFPNVTMLISLFSQSQVLVNSNLGCKVSGFRPLQEDKIEAIYTTLVREDHGEIRAGLIWFLHNISIFILDRDIQYASQYEYFLKN